MKTESNKYYTISEIAEICHRPYINIYRLIRKAQKSSGRILFKGVGEFMIAKVGKQIRLFRINTDSDEMIQILNQLKEYVCDDCIEVINQVINNVK